MTFLIYFLLFTLTYAHKCSFETPVNYEHIYLCREKLNSTSIRIWLHLKFNKNDSYELNYFSYYSFTLRIIDLIDEHKIDFKDRFEKQISNYVEINFYQQENNTINIHNLSPGRYEICVNFLNKNNTKIYYRSSNSCLYIPWNISEHEKAHPNAFIYVLFIILIIILLVTIAFVIYNIYQYFKSGRSPRPSPVPVTEEIGDEDHDTSERARFLVNQHFPQDTNPFVTLARRRFHQRYAHRSSDVNGS